MTSREKSTVWVGVARNTIVVLLPIVLVLASVWILLITAKSWIKIEYRLPGFPEDRYGFTLEDRLHWASIDIDYLLNDQGLEYFDGFQLANGEPMHNTRELRHMDDVKQLIQAVWKVWLFGAVLILVIVFSFWRVGDIWVALQGLQGGAQGTFVIMGVLVVGVLVAFGVLFVGFHRIFFEGNTWIFSYSDTFIRLYPERFWRDTFIYAAIVTLVEASLVYLLSKRLLNRKSKGEVN